MGNVGTGKSGTRFIKREWPVTEGLTAGTQKQEGRISNLQYKEKSVVEKKDKKGIN